MAVCNCQMHVVCMVIDVRIQKRKRFFQTQSRRGLPVEWDLCFLLIKDHWCFEERGGRGCFHSGCQGLGLGRYGKWEHIEIVIPSWFLIRHHHYFEVPRCFWSFLVTYKTLLLIVVICLFITTLTYLSAILWCHLKIPIGIIYFRKIYIPENL